MTVVRIGPNTVRIGIDAPPHVEIVREELRLDESLHDDGIEDIGDE